MALVTCAECGAQMSDKAAACPKCGAPNPAVPAPTTVVVRQPEKKTGGYVGLIFGGIFGLLFLGWLASEGDEGGKEQAAKAEEERIAAMTPEQRAAALEQTRIEAEREQQEALRREGLIWNYPESTDKMTGKVVKSALIRSTNEVEFEFPYQGKQRASLQLRKHPRFGNDVMFLIERGQLICGVSGCSVRVRFGNGQVQTFSASGPDDYSNDMLFIQGYDRFVAALRGAKVVAIEASVHHEGNVSFLFNTAGLQW